MLFSAFSVFTLMFVKKKFSYFTFLYLNKTANRNCKDIVRSMFFSIELYF